MHHPSRSLIWLILLGAVCAAASAAEAPAAPSAGDRMLQEYFRTQTAAIADACLADIHTLEDWTSRREVYRRQLAEMLGLWPMPPRTDLKPVITGRIDHGDFVVEKLQLQSMPGLYVSADLYIPKNLASPAPAILYACGHAQVKKDGIAYGAKAFYQHHGAWFARNGYVCLIADTLVNGEIEGVHHGLYRLGQWWWVSCGYTPAGVEAWNGIRCLDYLQSRPEVDPQRIGVTGRSGGGAYTWWVSALDERVKVAVPVAGITDLQNHIVDGAIEGHCDCMYMVNTYRWDFPQVAALIAPRPLLIENTDKDSIFPLDGVVRLHKKAREIYRLYKADDKLGLVITEGPHKDTQDLQVPAFRWFNRFLKGDEGPLKDATAEKLFEPEQLKVFPPHDLPADQINTRIQETFVPMAPAPPVPASKEAWAKQRDGWMAALRTTTFGGWPADAPVKPRKLFTATRRGLQFSAYEFGSQPGVPLRLYIAQSAGATPRSLQVNTLDEAGWSRWLSAMRVAFADELGGEIAQAKASAVDESAFDSIVRRLGSKGAIAWFAPRGVGWSAWSGDERKQTHIRRRFVLLGQTLDGMRVWDVRRAIAATRSAMGDDLPVTLHAEGRLAGVALYASLFTPGLARLELIEPPATHRDGPDLLNVLKTLDMPAAMAMGADRCGVSVITSHPGAWSYPLAVLQKLNWPAGRLTITQPER